MQQLCKAVKRHNAMKTILEVSTKGNKLWSMPDEVYPYVVRLLQSPAMRTMSRSGRSHPPTVSAVVSSIRMCIPEMAETITCKETT